MGKKGRMKSLKDALIKKSREAALAAVQVFNNPSITFKSEIYVVLMIIAWTYLLHAYYRKEKIDYKYFSLSSSGRKKFDKTKRGAFKYWELERCLNNAQSPLDNHTANNLRFLIGLRHEVEHQMTIKIDNLWSARFQASCLNFNDYIKKLFGDKYGIDRHLSFSLQFASLTEEQIDILSAHPDLPPNIKKFIEGFDSALSTEEFNHEKFAYRVIFVAKTVNNVNQADRVIEFVKPGSDLAENVNIQYAAMKETEKPKYLPNEIITMMHHEGYSKFKMHDHTTLWKKFDAKNSPQKYGTQLSRTWYWYQNWLNFVREHCAQNAQQYKD